MDRRLASRLNSAKMANDLIRSGRDCEGVSLRHVSEEIGNGVFATQTFYKDEYLVCYTGDLIDRDEAEKREKTYSEKDGSYLYFFRVGRKMWCVDSTVNRGTGLGRFVNDALAADANGKMRVVMIGGSPHLALFASCIIRKDEEVRYDYGVSDLPWRQKKGLARLMSMSATPIDNLSMILAPDNQVSDESTVLKTSMIFTQANNVSDESAIVTNSSIALSENNVPNESAVMKSTPIDRVPDKSGVDDDASLNIALDDRVSDSDMSSIGTSVNGKQSEVRDSAILCQRNASRLLSEDCVIIPNEVSADASRSVGEVSDISDHSEVHDDAILRRRKVSTAPRQLLSEVRVIQKPNEVLAVASRRLGEVGILRQRKLCAIDAKQSSKGSRGIEASEVYNFETADGDNDEVPDGNVPSTSHAESNTHDSNNDCSSDDDQSEPQETIYPNVVVYVKQRGSTVKNRKHPCYFCEQEVFQMNRHLERTHSEEHEVAEALSHKDKKNRIIALKRISKCGTFNHNIQVLQDKEGLFHVARSSEKHHIVEHYVPCKYCYAFYVKKELAKHCQKCELSPGFSETKSATSDGRLLLQGALDANCSRFSEELKSAVLNHMFSDKLTSVVKKDSIILQFGLVLLRKLGPKKHNDIAQRMRQLARIAVRIATMQNVKQVSSLETFICGASFDTVIGAILEESQEFIGKGGRNLLKNPNLALKVGHSFLKLAKLKLGSSIRTKDAQNKANSEEFIALYLAEYTDLVASKAHASVKIMPRKLQDFPDSTDLALLKKYQIQKSEELVKIMNSEPNEFIWQELAEVTMSRLIVFNARRGAEVNDVEVVEYNARTNAVHTNVLSSMTDEERKMIDSMRIIPVIGKRSRTVPILLNSEMLVAMQALYLNRKACHVNSDLFFAVPRTNGCFYFYPVLQKIAALAGMAKPSLLTTTRMRKHHATMAQFLEMLPSELEWLSCHMGHDKNVHKTSYRLHTSAIEITKVGKLLNAIDSGIVGRDKPAKPTLSAKESIDCDMETSSDDENDQTATPTNPSKEMKRKRIIDQSSSSEQDMRQGQKRNRLPSKDTGAPKYLHEKPPPFTLALQQEPSRQKKRNDKTWTPPAYLTKKLVHPGRNNKSPEDDEVEEDENTEEDEVSEIGDAEEEEVAGALRPKKRQRTAARLRYSTVELELLKKLFSKLEKPPSNAECSHALEICPSLRVRKLANIKSRAWSLNPNSKK